MGGRKVSASQCSYEVTTGQSLHLGKSKPSGMETMVHTQVASKVEMSEIGQSGSKRVVEIRGSLYCRAVVESRLDNCCM